MRRFTVTIMCLLTALALGASTAQAEIAIATATTLRHPCILLLVWNIRTCSRLRANPCGKP